MDSAILRKMTSYPTSYCMRETKRSKKSTNHKVVVGVLSFSRIGFVDVSVRRIYVWRSYHLIG